MSQAEHIQKTTQLLNSISPSMCFAKWTQVSIHLQNGTTHSCHHPPAHKIPVELLKDNPSVLLNTPETLEHRKQMIAGERPKGCNYCWRVEDAPGNNISDRVFKSSYTWSLPHKERIVSQPLNPKFTPSYVEVNLGDICNFKCSYCNPDVSTAWMSEIKKFGAYPTSSRHMTLNPDFLPIPEGENNPYKEAFWKWWPDLYPSLQQFRVTGGEPLMNSDFYKVLDWIKENPKPDLIFGINTNLCPPKEKWNKFLSDLKSIVSSGNVKQVQLYTSAEAWGDKAEYIRFGMDFEMWRERMWQVLEEVPQVRVTIMATYNALSVSSFDLLLEEVLKIKATERLYNADRLVPVFIDISYLRYPHHQTIKILTPEFKESIERSLRFMSENPEKWTLKTGVERRGFHEFEIQKMERILNWFMSDQDELDAKEKKETCRKDFYKFFKEHDRRRNTDFVKTYPEYEKFWNECATLAES